MSAISLINFFSSKKQKKNNLNEIIKQIDDCCNEIAIINPTDEKSFQEELKKLVKSFQVYFDSLYCAIGTIDEKYVEDCVTSQANENNENRLLENKLNQVKRVSIENKECAVCKYLSSTDIINYVGEDEIKKAVFLSNYEDILGVTPKNTTIIYLQDKNKVKKGFVQLINSPRKIIYKDIKPFYECLQRLILTIQLFIQRLGALTDAELFKKDFNFFIKAQGKIHNVDELLHEIMKYLSKEFHAGVVSFRIPLLDGPEKTPLFYLRECFICDEVAQYYNKEDYFNDRLVKTGDEMGGYEKLSCKNNRPIIIDKAKDTDYYKYITDKHIIFHDHTLMIPILRDFSGKDLCVNPHKNRENPCINGTGCCLRLEKYYGVFKLRILKTHDNYDSEENVDWLSDETYNRLSFLAKHISMLMNSILDKQENESLDIFQKELHKASFTKIKEFDEQCVQIVKKSIHPKICIIYRYKDNKLTTSASTRDTDQIDNDFSNFMENVVTLIESNQHDSKSPYYYIYPNRDTKSPFNSIMIVPMTRKNKTKLGVMALVGKEDYQGCNISKTFGEHDKKHIEYIVNVLTRIEESDSERLSFLAQLSHELLRPITEMVYRNDYVTLSALKDPDSCPKSLLIKEMQNNVYLCMSFKYIIDDVEYIYSLSKGDVQYNFEMIDFKELIIKSIRLFEEEASASKGLTIKTFMSKIPEKIYIDKTRMMQVIINLLRNAIRYSNKYEEISISYSYNEKMDRHEIDFKDYGISIEPEDEDRIFGLFTRSKNAMEKVPNGSGIGLYLVKQIMKAHGGDCYVKKNSSPTILTIQLPNKK